MSQISERGEAIAIFAKVPMDRVPSVVLVKDTGKPEPHFWKLPGGKVDLGETCLEAAFRELEEETGIRARPEDFRLVCQEDRRDHDFFLYEVEANLGTVKSHGNEGEMVRICPLDRLSTLRDFFGPHKRLLTTLGIISS